MGEYPTRRCFIALPLERVVTGALGRFMDGVDLPGLRRVPPENLHVTVKFLGDVEDPALEQVIEALDGAVAGAAAFDLAVEAVTYLPDRRRPRVLAAALSRPEAVVHLHGRIEDALAETGFRREARAYNPHVTLGRFGRRRRPRSAAALPPPQTFEVAPVGFSVDQVLLMQSELKRSGPRYLSLARFDLDR